MFSVTTVKRDGRIVKDTTNINQKNHKKLLRLMFEKLKLSSLEVEEREILLLLKKKEKCLYGNIFKELNLSYSKGAELIFSLVKKGFIRNVGTTSYYELNVDITE
jgi:hypothetical protein